MELSHSVLAGCGIFKTMDNSTHIPAEPAVKPKAHAEHVKPSFGEHAFNWLTYGAWNHGVNLILSTLIAYAFTGSKLHKNTIGWVKKYVKQDSTAEMITGITVLSSGGHLTALGVKPLEDRKPEIVQALNAKFSPQEADAPLVDDRKQTWLSVLGARVSTLALAIVSFSGIKGLIGNNADGKSHLDAFQDSIGRKFASRSKTAQAAADVTKSGAYKLGSILSLEIIIVTVMSSLFYFLSKLLSKKEPELLPSKVKPKVAAGITTPEAETELPKTNFAERIREQEAAESLGVIRA